MTRAMTEVYRARNDAATTSDINLAWVGVGIGVGHVIATVVGIPTWAVITVVVGLGALQQLREDRRP